MPKVTNVIGSTVRSAPKRRMSTSSFISCFTEPAPRPAARVMYPIWLMVEPARAFLMSSLAQPMMAPKSRVTAPTMVTASLASWERSKMGAEREQQADRGERGVAGRARVAEHAGEAHRAERGEHEEDGDGQAEVADAVGDEGLLGRHRRLGLVLPEPDQQVGGQADALPAHIQRQVVVGE